MKKAPRGVARSLAVGFALTAALLALPGATTAQTSLEWDPRGAELGRAEMQQLLERLEEAAASSGYSSTLRSRAAAEAAVVRTRLEEGDFQIGDRVVLRVEGEPQLSDTVAVGAGRTLQLPDLGPIPLTGVLRSELEEHLTAELGRYLQDPVVHASSLIRIAVLGSVGSQGFYTMPASALIEEALMRAGGPAGNAALNRAHILRGDQVIWQGDALQDAIRMGRTLDQLSLRAGDRIMVPERKPGFFEQGVLRTLLITLPPLIYLFTRLL